MIEINRISALAQKEILKDKLKERTHWSIVTSDEHRNNEQNRLAFYKLCEEDWKFFVNNAVWIQDPESDEKDIPFLLYDYQEQAGDAIVKAIEEGYDMPLEKCRKTGITWLMLAIILWGWQFKKWDSLVGSNKFENVDKRGDTGTLFQKLRYMIYKLPKFIFPKPLDHYTDKNGLITHPSHGARIAGEANNDNFGRSDRTRLIFMDEFTSWEQTDRAAWQSCSATSKCRVPVSTPNRRGTNCWHHVVIDEHKKSNKPYIRLEWNLHPVFADGMRETAEEDLAFEYGEKYTSPWLENEIKRASDRESVAQEILINYEASAADKVYHQFSYKDQVVSDLEYDPNLPLYVAWDFGLDQTAMIWIQPDGDNFYIIDEYTNKSLDIYHYIDVLESKDYKGAIHYGDPHSGGNRNITNNQSVGAILRRHGLIFKCQRARIKERIQSARNLLPQFLISDKCILTINMFTSWQMRKPKSGNTVSETPDHSEHSHLGEAYSYFCHNYVTRRVAPKSKKKFQMTTSGVMY